MGADDPNGRNKWNKSKPIGIETVTLYDNEGTDAQGRQSQVVRDEYPTRVDEVTDSLILHLVIILLLLVSMVVLSVMNQSL
jgi:hypothetical protein